MEFWSQAKLSIARGLLPGLMLVVLTIVLGIVMVRLMQMETSIPVSSTDVEAAARANERMTQMIQWTLTSVLGLGLALIGINWFTTTRDRAEVAALECQLRESNASYQERLEKIDAALLTLEKQRIAEELRMEQRRLKGADQVSTSAYCARVFETAEPGSLRQRVAAELMISLCLMDHANSVETHRAIRGILPKLGDFDPALAFEASQVLVRDLTLAPTLPESERPEY